MKHNGYTLIELMIVIAILAIFASIFWPVVVGFNTEGATWTATTGWTEERCIAGYKFVKAQRGAPTQILDASGKGIPCK